VSRAVATLEHPKISDPTLLTRIGERLQRDLGAEHVIVYGSVAWGKPTRDSDIDLLVIAPCEGSPYERITTARAAIRELTSGLTVSPLVVTPGEVQQRLKADDRFIRLILETGVEVMQGARRSARSRWGGMRPMPRVKPSDSWREHARQDWGRLQLLLGAGDASAASWFLQQAIEKYLKGWLLDHGWPLQKTHDLKALLNAACAYNSALAGFLPLLDQVSSYYWVDRYPGAGGTSPTVSQVETDRDDANGLILALFPDEQV
jgi:HEPN domain-containing protein/predicted nucleotidyltransferase